MNGIVNNGYQQMPEWLAEVMEKLSEESKDLARRAYDTALEAGKTHQDENAEGAALGAMVGICVQMGLNLIAKATELQPLQRMDIVANQMAREVHNCTLLTFTQVVSAIAEAEAAAAAGKRH